MPISNRFQRGTTMKDTLASLFNMLPQPFRELDFSMLVRRYLNMFSCSCWPTSSASASLR